MSEEEQPMVWPKETFLPPEAIQAYSLESKVNVILVQLAYINRAFPDGVDSHRKAHEAMMRAAVAEEKFWTELKLDIAKKGVFALLITVLGLAAVGLAAKFGLSSLATSIASTGVSK